MNMKKILILIVFLYVGNIFGQTHVRKTRSDKGGKHKHSLNYEIKRLKKIRLQVIVQRQNLHIQQSVVKNNGC
jgi:hypothetical protein